MTDEIHQTLAEWVLSVAPDYERDVEIQVDDDVEWSIGGAHVGTVGFMDVDGHAALEVEGMTTGRQQRRVRRSTRWEPAEYETKTVDIHVHVVFHFEGLQTSEEVCKAFRSSDEDRIGDGYADVRAEQFDYPFERSIPEPHEV